MLAQRFRTRWRAVVQREFPAACAAVPAAVWRQPWVADMPREAKPFTWRYFGWLAPAAQTRWQRILALLDWTPPALVLPDPLPPPLCPCCQKPMVRIGLVPRPPP